MAKKKPGRPKGEPTTRVAVRIPDRILNEIDAVLADEAERSPLTTELTRTDVIRAALTEFLTRRKAKQK